MTKHIYWRPFDSKTVLCGTYSEFRLWSAALCVCGEYFFTENSITYPLAVPIASVTASLIPRQLAASDNPRSVIPACFKRESRRVRI